MAARPLKDAGILITRPVGQGDALTARLEAKGAEVLHIATIEIAPVARSPELERSLEPLDSYHYAIFISPNAVEYAAELVKLLAALPAKLKVAAIAQIARALTALGRKPDILPRDGANSEALLRLKTLNKVDGKHILIVVASVVVNYWPRRWKNAVPMSNTRRSIGATCRGRSDRTHTMVPSGQGGCHHGHEPRRAAQPGTHVSPGLTPHLKSAQLWCIRTHW